MYTAFWLELQHVVFDELLKETGHGSSIIVSKYPEISGIVTDYVTALRSNLQ